MLLVIFGAGATYDSAPSIPLHHEHRPPLADELFSDRPRFRKASQLFPECQSILPFLETRPPGQSVEDVLARLQEENIERRPRHMLAVKHYIRQVVYDSERLWLTAAYGITTHRAVFDRIAHHRKQYKGVSLVTFNYDTLIERAMADDLGIHLENLSDYIADPFYHFVKLHGSIAWAHEVTAGAADLVALPWLVAAREVIARAGNIEVSGAYRMGPALEGEELRAGTFGANGPVFVPAIAIPVKDKKFECPDEHVAALYQRMPQVSRLLIIGWRGMEQHFLAEMKARMRYRVAGLIVGANLEDAQRTRVTLREAGVGGELKASESQGFRDFLLSGEVDRFLA